MRTVYARKMDEVWAFCGSDPLQLNGDGRFDSMGHSALYGTYTMMDAKTNLIVACQTVKVCLLFVLTNSKALASKFASNFTVIQCTETTSSGATELEGLVRCREEIEYRGYDVATLTTDRHMQITPYMRKYWKEVTHQFDIWHVAKGEIIIIYNTVNMCRFLFMINSFSDVFLYRIINRTLLLIVVLKCVAGIRKKLKALASKNIMNNVIYPWISSIIDHLYFVVHHSIGEHRIAWWKTAINHCSNIHQHDSNLVPTCTHGQLNNYKIDNKGFVNERVWLNTCK